MYRLTIEHFGGSDIVTDSSSLRHVLAKRCSPTESNDFWISGESRYPALAILVREQLSCLHFIPRDGHPGFQSRGDANDRGQVTFFTNTSTEQIDVPNEAVVPFEQALHAAEEFAQSNSL